jgi:hypothetical protein
MGLDLLCAETIAGTIITNANAAALPLFTRIAFGASRLVALQTDQYRNISSPVTLTFID